jgi:hypothetical protein
MVRRVGGPQPTHSALPILAPYLAPIRTHLTRVTRFSRCTPHGTVAHVQLSSWQAKCARSAGRLLIILDTLVRGSRRAAADGVRLGARRCRKAQHNMSGRHRHLAFLAACGQGRWKCRVRVSVLGRVGVLLWDSVVLSSRCQGLSKEPSSSALASQRSLNRRS